MPSHTRKKRKLNKKAPSKAVENPFAHHSDASGAIMEFLDLPGLARFGSLCKSNRKQFHEELAQRLKGCRQLFEKFETTLGLLRDDDDNTPYSFLSTEEYYQLRSAMKIIDVSRRMGRSLRLPREDYCKADKFAGLCYTVLTNEHFEIPEFQEPFMIQDDHAIEIVGFVLEDLKTGQFGPLLAVCGFVDHYPELKNYLVGEIRRFMYKERCSSRTCQHLIYALHVLLGLGGLGIAMPMMDLGIAMPMMDLRIFLH